MSKLTLDHFAVVASSLDEGVAYVEQALGVHMPFGGAHVQMGTHNHLMRLGDELYMEVIAIDPKAPKPEWPRWFALDQLGDSKPFISTWIVRTDDIRRELDMGPENTGKPVALNRGELSWQISIPEDGSLPFDGAWPSLIQWPEGPHPARKMVNLGCSLETLLIRHPDQQLICDYLGDRFQDPRVVIEYGETFSMTAQIKTPDGVRSL